MNLLVTVCYHVIVLMYKQKLPDVLRTLYNWIHLKVVTSTQSLMMRVPTQLQLFRNKVCKYNYTSVCY